MLFTTFDFLVLLAGTTVVYYLFPERYRWSILLVSSLVFYAFCGIHNAVCLGATIFTTYAAARITGVLHNKRESIISSRGEGLPREEKLAIRQKNQNSRRICLTICLLMNLGFLAMVKLDGSMIIPLGLSFYTFRAVGYLIDVYRGETEAERSLPRFILFCAFFPQMIQGPISRYKELAPTLFDGNRFDADNLSEGARRVLLGFFKKLVIADRLMPVVRVLIADTHQGADIAVALLLYAVALYCDFSGGIDIALGSAKMLGVKLPENFKKPFLSISITDFWQRWHITMGTWFRDYLFYPLSTAKPVRNLSKWMQSHFGNNVGRRVPVYFITLTVWFATGAWHGISSNYIGWGLANGIVIVLSLMSESLYKRFHTRFPNAGTRGCYKAFAVVRTFLLMRLIGAFFLFDDVSSSLQALWSVFTRFRLSDATALTELMPFEDWVISGAGVALLIVLGMQKQDAFTRLKPILRQAAVMLLLLIVLLFGKYGFGFDMDQFVYNRF